MEKEETRAKGSWVRNKDGHEEILYPDFCNPVHPKHWDYINSKTYKKYRIFPGKKIYHKKPKYGPQSLKKYELDFDKTINYLRDSLDRLDTLSRAVEDFTPFFSGLFYTYLDHEFDFSNKYVFEGGDVYGDVQAMVIQDIEAYCKQNKNSLVIFDDYNGKLENRSSTELYKEVGSHVNKAVCYILSIDQISKTMLMDCFNVSNAIWRSLTIVTGGNISYDQGQPLTEDQSVDIAKNAQYIYCVAYDDTGYIIWERNS